MNWISIVMLYAVTAALTGTVMLGIWAFCRIFLIKWNPDIIYYVLRWAVVMFVLPIVSGAMLLFYRGGYTYQADGWIWGNVFILRMKWKYVCWLVILWLVITLVNIIRFLAKEKIKRNLCKGNIPEDDPVAELEFERVKRILGVRGKIILQRNDLLDSPMVTGIFRRKVIVPYIKLEKEELTIIFYHELTHFKKHDLVYKMFSILIVLVQGFNPFSYLLRRIVNNWSEFDCDRRALACLEKEGIGEKPYYELILRLMSREKKGSRDMFVLSMLYEDRTGLERRIGLVNKYIKNRAGKVSKAVTGLLVAAFAVASTVTAYAASTKVSEWNDALYKETQEVETSYNSEMGETSEEFEITSEEYGDVEIVYVEDLEPEIMPLASKLFDWNVPAGVRFVTAEFHLDEGDEIFISCIGSPSDCKFWYGIEYPGGSSSHVCECNGGGSSHTFTAPYSGSYRMLVENRGSVTLNARGSYIY